nr:hypothetical protein [uncultured Campylobacter sp.]
MPKYSFKTIEQMLLKCVLEGGEPELSFHLRGERYFATLQELYAASQIDGRSLEELWGEADEFYCPNFEP